MNLRIADDRSWIEIDGVKVKVPYYVIGKDIEAVEGKVMFKSHYYSVEKQEWFGNGNIYTLISLIRQILKFYEAK